MKKYKVIQEYTDDAGVHAVGEVVEPVEGFDVSELVNNGYIELLPDEEAQTTSDEVMTPKGFFSVKVQWKEGISDEQRAEVEAGFINEFTKELSESAENHMPLVIQELTVKRI